MPQNLRADDTFPSAETQSKSKEADLSMVDIDGTSVDSLNGQPTSVPVPM